MAGRKRKGWVLRALCRQGIASGVMLIAGCATHVYPPARPPHPETVYLCDYGFHSSLLLPSGGDRYVEYNYGDWDFAAMNKTDPYHTVIALFHSRQAALGRRFLRRAPGDAVLIPPNKPHHIAAFVVDANRVNALVEALDERYRQNIATAYLNTQVDYYFMFVKDPQHYSLKNNCNTLTSYDLKALGCRLDGNAMISDFKVVAPLLSIRP